ncbi:MAG: NADP-dependent oxidoreductase [Candidatus Dormibacteraceae bacterium]
MKGAGIKEIGGPVEVLDLPEPADLRADEILIEVRAAGVANWDDIVRTGGWDVGIAPPMALGVEASGLVRAIGSAVTQFRVGDEVMTHPLPLRHQGAWSEQLVALEGMVAIKPGEMSWEIAGVLPVPALTADQVIRQVAAVKPGELVLVHGAGGVTGSLIVAVAAMLGAKVIATAGPQSAERVRTSGATAVFDYHDESWQQELLNVAGSRGVAVAINAVRGAAPTLIPLVADGGRLVTITSDGPKPQRGITVSSHFVSPDGKALARLGADFIARGLTIPVTPAYGLSDAAMALGSVVGAKTSGGVVIDPMR